VEKINENQNLPSREGNDEKLLLPRNEIIHFQPNDGVTENEIHSTNGQELNCQVKDM
jgi:hypothetical protein